METMEKVCPSCGKKCPPAAGFCTGCGTNIQAVAPTQTQAAAAMGQASAIAGSALASVKSATKGMPIMNFVPAVLAFCSAMCVLVGNWLTIKIIDFGFTFFELISFYEEYDDDLIILGILTIIFVAIPLLLVIAGAILTALKKTAGKVLSIIGNVFMILVLIAFFIVSAIAASEAEGMLGVGASPIFLFIFSIAGIVCAAIAKTGKKANPAMGFNPYMAQPQFVPQQPYAPQQTQAYNPNQNYNNPNQF